MSLVTWNASSLAFRPDFTSSFLFPISKLRRRGRGVVLPSRIDRDLMLLRVPGTRVPSPPLSLRASIGNCAARLGIDLHQPFRKKLIPFLDRRDCGGRKGRRARRVSQRLRFDDRRLTLRSPKKSPAPCWRRPAQRARAPSSPTADNQRNARSFHSRADRLNPNDPMSQRTENLEQFAIDVILERRHGFARHAAARFALRAFLLLPADWCSFGCFCIATASFANARWVVSSSASGI